MRIIAGAWRGRTLSAPAGQATRPTADRVRQALFDMLQHAPWGLPWPSTGVLDGFAGSGALGLEALSRGALHATFFESGRPARESLLANIARLQAEPRCLVLGDVLRPPPARSPCQLILLDPPYGTGLITPALDGLRRGGWVAEGAIVAVERAAAEPPPTELPLLAERRHGAARLVVWRLG